MTSFPIYVCCLVSLTDDKLVYTWGNLVADDCVVQVFDDAMAQYEYKGVKLSYNHSKVVSGMYLISSKPFLRENLKNVPKTEIIFIRNSFLPFIVHVKMSMYGLLHKIFPSS